MKVEIVRVPTETERIIIDRFLAEKDRAEFELNRVLTHLHQESGVSYSTEAKAWVRLLSNETPASAD